MTILAPWINPLLGNGVRRASPQRGTHNNVYSPWVHATTGADWHVLLVSIWPEVIFESWLLRAALWDGIALCCRLGWLRSDVGLPWNYPHAETGKIHNNKHIWTRGASGICLGAGWNYDSCCDGIRSALGITWSSHSHLCGANPTPKPTLKKHMFECMGPVGFAQGAQSWAGPSGSVTAAGTK